MGVRCGRRPAGRRCRIATGKMARLAAILLGAGLFLRVMTIHLPRMIVNLHDPGPWTSAGEMLAMCGGAFVLAGTLSGSPFSSKLQGSIPDRMTKLGRCLYAFPLFIFGTQHLMYARFVSTLVPAWIPGRLFWAYFVGIAFFAAAFQSSLGRSRLWRRLCWDSCFCCG